MIKELILLRRFNRLPAEERRIVFFSEGKRYWGTFWPVIRELEARGVRYAYISMEKDDPGLAERAGLHHGFAVGSGTGFMLFMSLIKADLVAMTTPGLQTLTLKRSPGVRHYTHLVHSPTGMAFYRRYSFEHFDSVLCSGEHQIEDIRALEQIRGSESKELFEAGCPYTDLLAERFAEGEPSSRSSQDGTTVLIAPTWGPNGALTRLGFDLLDPLITAGYNLIVRPHPQQLKSEPRLISSLKGKTARYESVVWDENPSGHQSFMHADIMISDLSGVIFDFALIYEKPVLTVDYPYTAEGFEQQDLETEPWEFRMRSELGGLIRPDDLDSLKDLVSSALNSEGFSAKMADIRTKYLYNYANSGKRAASLLQDIAAGIHKP